MKGEGTAGLQIKSKRAQHFFSLMAANVLASSLTLSCGEEKSKSPGMLLKRGQERSAGNKKNAGRPRGIQTESVPFKCERRVTHTMSFYSTCSFRVNPKRTAHKRVEAPFCTLYAGIAADA